ncbi:MAG TPA: hypothetical protein VMA13_02070 [Candidatus Saccharimonadales bacterium]|nr:hypothetical protein [Candidatus Saccharimonadales bacterium]
METKFAQHFTPPPAQVNGSPDVLGMVHRLARQKNLPKLQKLIEQVIHSGEGQSLIELASSLTMEQLAASKFCPVVEEDAPEWAKRAAAMVFISLMPPPRKRKASEAYHLGFESGYRQAAAELVSCELHDEYGSLLLEVSKEMQDQLKGKAAAQTPPAMAADFFAGIRDGDKSMRQMPERAQYMAQRTKIFRVLAEHWKEILPGKIQGTDQLHQWLLSKKVISPGTDSRETRQVCQRIGLRYRPPGRPRKKKMEPPSQS